MPRLNFKGKVFVENHHLAVPFHELLPVREKGLGEKASLHDNLIVQGDNLAALKSLLPTYHGKVKCVYIDPPYNTGKEGWAYNDKVNSPLMQDWLGRVVDRDDLTRHDKWCCMMLPRLKLLRELLRDDGVIFVSIDDNEVHHLRCLMDEVFGEHNRVGQIIWHGSTDNNPTKHRHRARVHRLLRRQQAGTRGSVEVASFWAEGGASADRRRAPRCLSGSGRAPAGVLTLAQGAPNASQALGSLQIHR